MSEKKRQKKEGQDKNKQNQARRQAEANPMEKRARSAVNTPAQRAETSMEVQRKLQPSAAPAAARAYASKAGKGK
jgi:hypothetical protein